jgi:hypothetical protein
MVWCFKSLNSPASKNDPPHTVQCSNQMCGWLRSTSRNHAAATARALDAIHFVELTTHLWIASVNHVRPFQLLKFSFFKFIEPKALTIRAAIHFRVAELHLGHWGTAFGTIHKA